MAASAYFDQVQQLYIAYFGRPADTIGLAHWAQQVDAANGSVAAVIAGFSASTESQALFGNKSTADKVNSIYKNLFGRDAEPAGLIYWVNKIDGGAVTQAQAAYEIQSSAGAGDATAVANKLAAAKAFTAQIDTSAEILGYQGAAAAQVARDYLAKVDATASSLSAAVDGAAAALAATIGVSTSDAFTLTNGTDVATANIFNSGLVYTPGGDDRINALQSEDVLTGTAGRTDNTLNATLGNANDNGAHTVTPTLHNIQNLNLQVTGDTPIFDARFADSLQSIALSESIRLAVVRNIGKTATDLAVKDTGPVGDSQVFFRYADGALEGTTAAGTAETGNLSLSNANLLVWQIGNGIPGLTPRTDGFETLNLNVSGSNTLSTLLANDLENLNISGSGTLAIVETFVRNDRVQYSNGLLGTGVLDVGDGLGIRTIDASGFTGTLSLDISTALGGHADPANSGAKYYATVTGGAGDDTFWVAGSIAAESATLKDVINGGTGADTLKLIRSNIERGTDAAKSLPTITNIETLELRLQGGSSSSVNLSAFDAALTSVVLRNERSTGTGAAAAGTFTLKEVSKAIAESGITLLHTSGAGDTGQGTARAAFETVNVRLNDSTGANDLVALTVKSDLNTSSTFNYQIKLATEAALATGATAAQIAANKVENLSITDSDTETNIVRIHGNDGATAKDLTGTLILKGGSAGTDYTVENTITAATVDASAQLSNVNLKAGSADQTIITGAGDDTVTFDGLDLFNGSDKLSGGAGTDTVRAAFSKDASGVLNLDGIEKLQIVATANSTIDLANGTGLTELAILSDRAVNENNEIFSTGITGVDTTDVITLKNTHLSAINFSGDQDTSFSFIGADQVFNGLTLENNASKNFTVNISAALANGPGAFVGNGVTSYTLGQLTLHGVTDLSIAVDNELSSITADKTRTATKIANIWDRDLVNLKLSAIGRVDVGTVTGNTTNNNLKTFDASAVAGPTVAVVKALGDAAVVTLSAEGSDVFDALGSAGNNIVINAGNGNNSIRGSAQSDIITTGSGNDAIDADRGNNIIKTGAGNDYVLARNGNNTVDLGSGLSELVIFYYDTDAQLALATNVVAGSDTSGSIIFNAVTDTTYGFAVGAGAELSIKFTGTVFDQAASTLNGRSAIVDVGGAFTGQQAAQSNLLVAVNNPTAATTVTGGSAADVFLDFSTGAGNDYNVSLGAGNDAVVMSQTSTGKHQITGGAGADKIVLSAASGADTLVIGAGDSVAGAHDVVTNFEAGVDLFKTGTAGTAGTLASTSFGTDLVVAVDANGAVSITDTTTGGPVVIGAPGGKVSIDALLSFLSRATSTNGAVYSFVADTSGDGLLFSADSVFVVQHHSGSADAVVELVGATALTGAQLVAAFAA